MSQPDFVHKGFYNHFPSTLTILVTYGCTAACEQCCFESNPKIKERLSLDQIKHSIRSAKDSFPALKLIVFSGGEAFMIKADLIKSVKFATSLGLATRIVTNGYWAKRPEKAINIAMQLKHSGLNEINISTGLDHQRWVTEETVLNACEALISQGIFTLVTVELDSEESNCFQRIQGNERTTTIQKSGLFKLMTNSWMSFQEDAPQRRALKSNEDKAFKGGCDQIYDNTVVTPHSNLSACCGLTLEHIPELRLGSLHDNTLKDLYETQFSDFLKTWIHVDGPYVIMEKLLGEKGVKQFGEMRHICEACAIMHKNPQVIKALGEQYHKHIPDVLARLNAKVAVMELEKNTIELATEGQME
jgi:hypothetical protein